MQQIHHKENELFEVEFFKDNECTEAFDFTNAKNLYIQPVNGDCTPLLVIRKCLEESWYNGEHKNKPNIFIPYLPLYTFEFWYSRLSSNIFSTIKIHTLSCINSNTGIVTITPNLSKYIPEDNAVIFLNQEDFKKYDFPHKQWINNVEDLLCEDISVIVTIFLTHGTQSELQQANEVAKHLWKNFGIKPNLCVLHWFLFRGFGESRNQDVLDSWGINKDKTFNKIITTTSTGILKPQNTERLQVIDAKEIFEEYLNENNLI